MVPLLDSALSLAGLVATRKLSPVELVDATLARIDALNPPLNALVAVDHDGARRAARDAEDAVMSGNRLGQLHGVPVTIKSSVSVGGLPWETGSRFRAGDHRRG